MAISSTATYGDNVPTPTGFVNPTLTPLPEVDAEDSYTVDLAQTRNAVATTGATNFLAAVEADFDTAQATRLGLDAATTINANLTIKTFKALNDGDDTSAFLTGTDVYRILVNYEYNKV
jgi:hypothetical protein